MGEKKLVFIEDILYKYIFSMTLTQPCEIESLLILYIKKLFLDNIDSLIFLLKLIQICFIFYSL